MGLEAASFISQLNAANPVGGVDNYSTADDHLRLLKSVLLAQFPNFTAAAVTATVAQINFLVGVTSGIQAQIDTKEATANKNAANGYAGLDGSAQLANARVSASNVTQHQAALSIALTQLTGATYPAASGVNITNLNASALASGSVPDARVPLSNVNQHQGSLSIGTGQLTGSMPDARIPASNVTQHQAALSIAATQLTGSIADARIPVSNVSQHQASIKTRNVTGKGGTSVTLQSGGSASGGSDGDVILIY